RQDVRLVADGPWRGVSPDRHAIAPRVLVVSEDSVVLPRAVDTETVGARREVQVPGVRAARRAALKERSVRREERELRRAAPAAGALEEDADGLVTRATDRELDRLVLGPVAVAAAAAAGV